MLANQDISVGILLIIILIIVLESGESPAPQQLSDEDCDFDSVRNCSCIYIAWHCA